MSDNNIRQIGFTLIILLYISGIAHANIIENRDMGWQTLINNDYVNGSYINNTFIASPSFTTDLKNEVFSITPNSAIWNISTGAVGYLYIGQLYPAGHARYRFNISFNNSVSVPSIHIYNGKLFHIQIAKFSTYYKVILNYYNDTGVYKQDKYWITNDNSVDIIVEQFSNGTTILYNNDNHLQQLTTKYHLDWQYPYDYISDSMIQITFGLSGESGLSVVMHNFEQHVPKKLITVNAINNLFPFGIDGPRANYSDGTDWLKNNGQRATIWAAEHNWNAILTPSQRIDVLDLLNNKGFELGIHFKHALNDLSWANATAEMDNETTNVSAIYGKPVLSWVSLGNDENSTHTQYMWDNHNVLWRNAPQSNAGDGYLGIYAIYSASSVSADSNIRFWDIASQYKSFHPIYTHSISNPLQEANSINTTDFVRIFTKYITSGVSIIPYGEWYYTNMLTVTNITNILLSPSDSHFNINTYGYNASITIYDPNGEGIWFANDGTVITTIDNTNETNLIINIPSNRTIQKANAILIVSSNNISVNISIWNTTNDYRKVWTEASSNNSVTTQHIIGDFPPNSNIIIKKNGADYGNFTSNNTGYISFNYEDGYSDIQFDAQVGAIPSSIFSILFKSTFLKNLIHDLF